MPNNAKITILGNLTKDPVTRKAGANTVVALSVAVSTMNKDDSGNYLSDFYDVSVWGKNGEYLMQKVQKGTQVLVTGDFSTGSYDAADGTKRTVLRVTATDVRPLTRLKGETAPQGKPAGGGYRTQGYNAGDANALPF